MGKTLSRLTLKTSLFADFQKEFNFFPLVKERFFKVAFSLMLCGFFFFNICHAKSYTAGLVGINSVVPGAEDNNITPYFNLKDKKDPMAYAQEYFTEIFTTELADVKGFTTLDMSERTTLARRDEVILQLNMGNPLEAVKLFDIYPDYLIYGNIDGFTVTRRESLGSNNISVEVRLSVRVFDTETKNIVMVATGRGKASTHSVDFEDGEKLSIERWREALDEALMEIVGKVKKEVE